METKAHYRQVLSKDFRYLHEPLRNSQTTACFVGRTEHARALADRVMFSRGGAFLVTGFRGVGKTTFVHQVLDLIRQEAERYARVVGDFQLVDVWLNLARPLSPPQLMHHIIRHLFLRLKEMGLLGDLDSELREDLQTAFLRTTFEISWRSLTLEERGREASLGLEKAEWLGIPFLANLSGSHKHSHEDEDTVKYLPYDERAAEFDILNFSSRLLAGGTPPKRTWQRFWRWITRRNRLHPQMKVAFVLDELDKLDLSIQKESQSSPLDLLLESLKTIFTTAGFSFVFVAGKETQERLARDIALGDSIYESIFAYDVYLPCLWEEQDELVIRRIRNGNGENKGDAVEQNIEGPDLLRSYLQYKGRGVPRRILRELNSYVAWEGDSPVLSFDSENKRYMTVFAKLQGSLDQTPALYGTGPQRFDRVRFDRQRLCLYYTLDWILSRRREPFTLSQVQQALQSLNLGLGAQESGTLEVAEAIQQMLLRRAFIERILATATNIGEGAIQSKDKFRLSDWCSLPSRMQLSSKTF